MSKKTKKIVEDRTQHYQQSLDSLQHKRDVACLTTMFLIHDQHVPHLQPMRLPGIRAARPTDLVVERHTTKDIFSPDISNYGIYSFVTSKLKLSPYKLSNSKHMFS